MHQMCVCLAVCFCRNPKAFFGSVGRLPSWGPNMDIYASWWEASWKGLGTSCGCRLQFYLTLVFITWLSLRDMSSLSFIINEIKRDVFYVFQNYKSCFVDNSEKLGNLDQPYEIMNRSSMNYLTFSQENNAIYIFNVKIVDPNYRCLSLSF